MNALVVAALAFLAAAPQDATIPAHARQVQQVQGRGVQLYRCGAKGWTLVGPDAKLYSTADPASPVAGTHTAGPTWTWIDGSAVHGTKVREVPSPDPQSIPWLLLTAEPAAEQTGMLSHVRWVRRSDTHGGVAPAGACDAAHLSAEQRVPYTATYTFYSASAHGPSHRK